MRFIPNPNTHTIKMKNTSHELKELLPAYQVQKDPSILSYFPLLFSLPILLLTATSFLISYFSKGFPALETLPQANSSLMAIGIFISALPGFFTVWAFHLLIWCKQKSFINTFCLTFSFLSGTLSQISLLIFSLTVTEQALFNKTVLIDQEEIALGAFFISCLIFECFSLTLLLQLGQENYRPVQKWIVFKLFLLMVILTFSIMQGGLALIVKIYANKELFALILDVLNYISFGLHLIYFGTFCYDLEDVKVIINLGKEYEDSVNTSTF